MIVLLSTFLKKKLAFAMDKYRLVQEHKGATSTTTNSMKQEGAAPDGDGGDSSSTQQQQSQQQQQQQKGDSTTTTTTSTTNTTTTTTNTNMSCEVRITQQGKPRNYITYSMKLFVSQVISSIELNTHLLGSYL